MHFINNRWIFFDEGCLFNWRIGSVGFDFLGMNVLGNTAEHHFASITARVRGPCEISEVLVFLWAGETHGPWGAVNLRHGCGELISRAGLGTMHYRLEKLLSLCSAVSFKLKLLLLKIWEMMKITCHGDFWTFFVKRWSRRNNITRHCDSIKAYNWY